MSTAKSNNIELILSRLSEAVELLGLNKSKVAKITGYSKGQVGWMLEGKTPLSDKFLKIFCSTCNVSEVWLKTGEGPTPKAEPKSDLEEMLQRIVAEGDTTKEIAVRALLTSLDPGGGVKKKAKRVG